MGCSTGGGYEGVILAAGRGTRMTPFSEHYPKPLLPIANQPLIHHQIEYLRSLGVTRVFVVIGHLGHEIALDLRRGEALGVEVEYVEQEEALGIAHALMQLERRVNRPFVLLLGDIYLELDRSVDPLQMLADHEAAAFLAVMREPNTKLLQRNFAVHQDESGRVHRVIEKPRFPHTEWKGCGLYAFDVSFFDAIRRTPRSAGRNEYELTDAIQTYIDDGAHVICRPMVQRDINLTFPYDLLLANLRALRAAGRTQLIAPSASVHPKATLQGVVVGAGARITEPIALTNTLVFPNTSVAVNEPVERAILTPDHMVDCRYWLDERGDLRDASRGSARGAADPVAIDNDGQDVPAS